jgi:hypothetical protein
VNILNQEAPELSDRLRRLSLEQQRRALVGAMIAASQHVENLEQQLVVLLEVARRDNALSPQQIADASEYAEFADDRYLTLKENGAPTYAWMNWFAKARLATAIRSLFRGTSWEEAADAAYELCFVLADKSAAVDLLRSHIEASTSETGRI